MKRLVKRRKGFLVLLLILVAFITMTYLFSKSEYYQNFEKLKYDTQYEKKLIVDRSLETQRISEQIANEIEIVVLKETGNIQLFHDKTPENNKYMEWIVDSNISLKVCYTATLSIDTKDIEIVYNEVNDKINIVYNSEMIRVTSINIDDILSETSKGLFGKQYSEKEVTTLTLLATDRIKEQLTNDTGLKLLASINLEEYLRNMAYNLRIYDICILQKDK